MRVRRVLLRVRVVLRLRRLVRLCVLILSGLLALRLTLSRVLRPVCSGVAIRMRLAVPVMR